MDKDMIVIPKKGEELYEGLLDIFKGQESIWSAMWYPEFGDESGKDEYYLDEGISEARGYLLDYIKYGESYLENEREHPPISSGCYILIWVLLKTQPNSGVVENERAQRIYEEFNGRDLKHDEKDCILFNKCVELVNRILSPENAFEKAEESLRFAMTNVRNAQKKVRDLKCAVKFGREKIESQNLQIKSLKNHIDDLEKECEQLEKERQKIQKNTSSEEYLQKIGEKYLVKVFEEYLKGASRWSQSQRDNEPRHLALFLSSPMIPQRVRDMVRALAEDKEERQKGGVTVKAEAGATVNNYDIHGNNQVNTNKKD